MIKALVRSDGMLIGFSEDIYRNNPGLKLVLGETWDDVRRRAAAICIGDAEAIAETEAIIAAEQEKQALRDASISTEAERVVQPGLFEDLDQMIAGPETGAGLNLRGGRKRAVR